MKKFFIIISIFGLLTTSGSAEAKIYKWVDENGKAHFTDDPSLLPEDDESKVETFREFASPPAKKIESRQETEKEVHKGKEGLKDQEVSISPETMKKNSGPPPDLVKLKKSYEQDLKNAQQILIEKQKVIAEIQRTGKRPENWHTKETAEQILERYQLNVKKVEKEIKQNQKKLDSLKLSD